MPYINSQEVNIEFSFFISSFLFFCLKLPFIIVYLISEGKKLSYVKLPAQNYLIYDFEHINFEFYDLIPYQGNAVNEVKEGSAGMIKLKLAIFCDSTQEFIENALKKWRQVSDLTIFKTGCLFMNIYQVFKL